MGDGIRASVQQVVAVSRWVLTHPSNRGCRWRRYFRAVAFQVLSRLWHSVQVTVRIGEHSRITVRRDDRSAMKCLYANPPDPEMNIWAEWLRPGDLFVDVGANSGTYTLWAADRGAEVIAVEPDACARRRLMANVARNGYRVSVLAAVLGERLGSVRFTRGRGPMNHVATKEEPDTVEVEVATLDQVIGDRRVAGVKIDVEGAERLVLLGGRRALREHRIGLLQLEWNNCCAALLGETREPVRALLESCGYRVFRPTEDAGGSGLDVGDADVFAVAPTEEARARWASLMGGA